MVRNPLYYLARCQTDQSKTLDDMSAVEQWSRKCAGGYLWMSRGRNGLLRRKLGSKERLHVG